MDLPELPDFGEFYSAINDGRKPFPWQARLAEEVHSKGKWPAEIGIPTGLGKTSCLDIAVWWLAAEADRSPQERRAPTRIWWVVNRRLLVDATAAHAECMAEVLRESITGASGDSGTAVRYVAERLMHIAPEDAEVPIQVVRLRGGVALGRPRDPGQPSIILSTVPMYGSRLLFRGYGSSRSMRPIDAAMAGNDSLVLVDEAHLAAHLMKLPQTLRECAPAENPVLPVGRHEPQMVSLTATGDALSDRFELDHADLAHEVVRQRLDASKRLKIVTTNRPDGTKEIATAATDLLESVDRPAACVVFLNTPSDARKVHQLLTKERGLNADVILLTGRTREVDAHQIRDRVLDPNTGALAGRRDAPRERGLVVVATQTLEVGADVDFEFLVTEQCGVRALVQRLGRLNRLGRFPDSRATYVHSPAPRSKQGEGYGWPVYGEEPTTLLERLEHAQGFDPDTDDLDVSPRRIADVAGVPNDNPGRAPEVLPALLWEWIKTTTPPPGEAPVEPYFSGIVRPDLAISLMWRCHVPPSEDRLWPRPFGDETVEVPLGEFRRSFVDRDAHIVRLRNDGLTVEEVSIGSLRPGDVVVLAADVGLLDEFGWAPESSRTVTDVSIHEAGLPLDTEALSRLCGIESQEKSALGSILRRVVPDEDDEEELDVEERAEAAEELVQFLHDRVPKGLDPGDWRDFLGKLDISPRDVAREVSRLAIVGVTDPARYDELDEVSQASEAVQLEPHGQAVGDRSLSIASALGLENGLAQAVGRSGGLHDVGKADERFQRWLNDGDPASPPLAKSHSKMGRERWTAAQAAAGWPRGGRHEELSARLAKAWLDSSSRNGFDADSDLNDLLLHLVVSHHGRGRPFVMPVADGTGSQVTCSIEGAEVSVSADLSIADWKQPERFARLNVKFGPWGLALLEAIVRQSDHVVSAAGDVR